MQQSNKIGIVIQARLGSSRLPSKVLKPFLENTLIGFLIDRLKKVDLELVVATTDLKKDQPLINYLLEKGIKYYKGSEDNVLERFIATAKENSFTHIVRVCADNPLVDRHYLDKLINYLDDFPDVDYLSYSFFEKPTILTHFGAFSEIVKVDALKAVKSYFPNRTSYQEHVTNGLYAHSERFNVQLIPIDERMKEFDEIRLTIDTIEDYNHILTLMQRYPHLKDADFEEIATCVKQESDLMRGMKASIEKNKK